MQALAAPIAPRCCVSPAQSCPPKRPPAARHKPTSTPSRPTHARPSVEEARNRGSFHDAVRTMALASTTTHRERTAGDSRPPVVFKPGARAADADRLVSGPPDGRGEDIAVAARVRATVALLPVVNVTARASDKLVAHSSPLSVQNALGSGWPPAHRGPAPRVRRTERLGNRLTRNEARRRDEPSSACPSAATLVRPVSNPGCFRRLFPEPTGH